MNTIQRVESALISPNLKTTSLVIAKKLGKRHDDVLKAIRNLDIPEEYRLRNFEKRDIIQQHSTGASKTKAYELKGGMDFEFRAEKIEDSGSVRIACTKMKDAKAPNDVWFKSHEVRIGNFEEDIGPLNSYSTT